jgi:hypothetical protein
MPQRGHLLDVASTTPCYFHALVPAEKARGAELPADKDQHRPRIAPSDNWAILAAPTGVALGHRTIVRKTLPQLLLSC